MCVVVPHAVCCVVHVVWCGVWCVVCVVCACANPAGTDSAPRFRHALVACVLRVCGGIWRQVLWCVVYVVW